jgi:hypothetical protein
VEERRKIERKRERRRDQSLEPHESSVIGV